MKVLPKIEQFCSEDESSNESDFDLLHRSVVIPIGDMFAKPIQNGVLNRSTLIKGLHNITMHKRIDNYFCFTDLILNNLNLKYIDIVGDYVSIKKLVLSGNCIKELNALNNLNELEYLDVSHNYLERVLNFSSPKMLYHVDYSYNCIEHMDDLTDFWCLAHLNLSHNNIKNVNGLQKLRYLSYLNLSHNHIKQVSHSLPFSLMEINLSYNGLEHIQLDMSSSNCEIFDVSHNKLKLLDFLKNAKHLSVLNIQHNMIDDLSQIENLKTLKNLCVLSADNNKFFEMNIHQQLFSNNLNSKATIDQLFAKERDLQGVSNLELYSMLTAKKNAIKSTVLEHLSGKSPISKCGLHSCRSLPMVILVGPPKACKKYLLNRIFMKHNDKFYRAFIYTTNNISKDKIFKTITTQEFNMINCRGEFVFSYRFFGHSYGLSEDQLFICNRENKVLITFTNLEGALSLKLLGINPIFVLVLPKDKSLYKRNVQQSTEKYIIGSKTKNTMVKEASGDIINTTDIMNSNNNLKPDNILHESSDVCLSYGNENADYKAKTVLHDNKYDFEDNCNDSCVVFTNECMNNLEMCYNLYTRSTTIFHSLVYVDNIQNALKEITTLMIDAYNKYKTNKKSETQQQPNKHTLDHIQTLYKELCNELQ